VCSSDLFDQLGFFHNGPQSELPNRTHATEQTPCAQSAGIAANFKSTQ